MAAGTGSFYSVQRAHLFSQMQVMEVEKYSNKDGAGIFVLGYEECSKTFPIFKIVVFVFMPSA